MKIVTVSSDFYNLCKDDSQLLQKTKRPHLLLVNLKYKGESRKFLVPFRSNIPPAAPKREYFALPPRNKTNPKHRHGLHYIKMFPISNEYIEKFWIGKSRDFSIYHSIISKNEKRIVSECQAYLNRYEEGDRPKFAVDIDYILSKIES